MRASAREGRHHGSRANGRHPYRREEILRVAVELFHQYGVSNTNVEVIAEKVGIRPATLYHHFRDKQAIVDAAVDLAHARLVSRLKKVDGSRARAADRLGRLIDELAHYVVEDLPLAAVGRNDRVHASQAIRRRAEQSEKLLLDPIVSGIAKLRPELSDAERRALGHALIGAIWSVTHSDLRLEPAALRQFLGRAGRTIVLGRRARRISAK